MKTNDQFQDAVSAYESVRAAKQELKEESKLICEEIAKAQDELAGLQTSYLPVQDLKEGIIQLLCCSGENFEMNSIRPAISALATNGKWGLGFPMEEYGKPINYKNMESAIAGNLPQFAACQIFTPDKSTYFDDRVFLGLLFKAIEPTIRNIMEKMQPEEFGYDHINPSEIGPGLEERRQMIQAIKAKIQALEEKKGAIAGKLSALGE